MQNITSWILFGIFISVIGNTFDLPLRVNKLIFSLIIGVVGSLIGGMFAYFVYGIEVQGINISTMFIVIFGSIASVLLMRLSGKNFTRGGER